MSTLSRLALLFIVVPLLELFILIQVGEAVGFWPTVGLVVLTGFAGAALARMEGLRILFKIRAELARADSRERRCSMASPSSSVGFSC